MTTTNTNMTPVVPVLDALEAFKSELEAYRRQIKHTSPENITRLERPLNAAAYALAELVLTAYETGAPVSFTSEVQS